jgi:hypothetical protein
MLCDITLRLFAERDQITFGAVAKDNLYHFERVNLFNLKKVILGGIF